MQNQKTEINYKPENLKLWEIPNNYFGEYWPDYYVYLGQTRDSDCLERSNFECGLLEIGGEKTDDNDLELVLIVRENHWACGWVQWIAIHKTAIEQLKRADEIIAAIELYPVLDDEHFSELEQTEANEVWANCYDWRERIQYIREHRTEFEFNCLNDMLACVRGKYFIGYANELVN